MTGPDAPRVDVEYLLEGQYLDSSALIFSAVKKYALDNPGQVLEIKVSSPDTLSLYIKIGKEVIDVTLNAAEISHEADELHAQLVDYQYYKDNAAVLETSMIGARPSGNLPDPE